MGDIEKGDTVILLDEEDRKRRVTVEDKTLKVKGIGIANLGKLVGVPFGEKVRLAGKEFVALRPSLIDIIETLERRAQIIVPKDSAFIVLYCGAHPGCRIVEGGSGSGALTVVLAGAVAPNGKVVSYDNRMEHQEVARRNVKRAGLSKVVEWKMGDVTASIEETGVDAVVLDIPNPDAAVDNATKALRPGGHFGAYVPTANQVERTVKALRKAGFKDVRALELILRDMEVSEGGVRPSFDMLGHTGYICLARWTGRP